MLNRIFNQANFIKQGLDQVWVNNEVISNNIANADTPFYRPRDIRFEEVLAQKSADIFGDKSKNLPMARTDGAHMTGSEMTNENKATVFFRDGHMARNDGNSVDLDVETTEMAKNSTMYKAIVEAMKKDGAIFKSVLDASSKTS